MNSIQESLVMHVEYTNLSNIHLDKIFKVILIYIIGFLCVVMALYTMKFILKKSMCANTNQFIPVLLLDERS